MALIFLSLHSKMVPLVRHKYSLVEDQLQALENSNNNNRKTKLLSWTEYEIRLPVALCVLSVVLLSWFASLWFLLYHKEGHRVPCLPINKQLYDEDGNYCQFSLFFPFPLISSRTNLTKIDPAAEAIEYEIRVFKENNEFMTMRDGPPSLETDEAWESVLEPTDGIISASYENGIFAEGLPKTIQSKYRPELNMYGFEAHHQIHCLNIIRKSFYPDHYFPNETKRTITYHREHCLDHIRQSLMCSGDFTLDRWEYDQETGKNWLKTDVPHICRKFDVFQDWLNKYKYVEEDWWREGDEE